eukprot:jgi/Botrbrau1/14438/Bobra.0014s0084.1
MLWEVSVSRSGGMREPVQAILFRSYSAGLCTNSLKCEEVEHILNANPRVLNAVYNLYMLACFRFARACVTAQRLVWAKRFHGES